MEFNALADLECPYRGIRAGFPALCQLRNQAAVCGDFGKAIAQLTELQMDHVEIENLTRIQHVAGGAAGESHPQPAALLRRGGFRAAQQCGGGGHGDPQRQRAGHEVPAAQPAGLEVELQTADIADLFPIPDAIGQIDGFLYIEFSEHGFTPLLDRCGVWFSAD